MSRTVHYDTNGNEIDAEDCINDAPTYAQEQLADLKEKGELMKMEKEKQMVARYEEALSYAACDYSIIVTNCAKCKCRVSCVCHPGSEDCRVSLKNKWKHDAGMKDNQSADDAPAHTSEQLADVECREEKAVNHPDYYKHGGIEAIDAIEAWGLGFNLGNVVKYIARAGHKTADSLQDLRKAAWYLDREIKRRVRE